MTEAVLEVHGLRAGYTDVNVLHEVSVRVGRASFVAVVGPNGAGKSTLLKAIYGLAAIRAGSIVLRTQGRERRIERSEPHLLTAMGLNYVPQLANVFPRLSVRENLEIGATLRRRDAAERIEEVMGLFPMLGERQRERAETLSGGQRQMLALARALVTKPEVLLLDEPSAGLAPRVVDELFEKLQQIKESGVAILLVEQNARRSLELSDEAYVLDMGRNHFSGRGPDLLRDPKVVELYLGGSGRLSAAGVAETAGEGFEAADGEADLR